MRQQMLEHFQLSAFFLPKMLRKNLGIRLVNFYHRRIEIEVNLEKKLDKTLNTRYLPIGLLTAD